MSSLKVSIFWQIIATFFKAYHYMSYEEDEHHPDVPIITLEVISRDSDCYYTARSGQPTQYYEEQMAEANTQVIQERGGGGGELTPKMEPQETEETERIDQGETSGSSTESVKSKSDLLEYLLRNDGSVVCKLCGEILQSRTHWYRHKYKLHVVPALNPSPLFQCEQCLVYFKSRKGYIGHIASRHGELSESPGAQPPPVQPPEVVITPVRMKQETPEPEVQPAGPAYTTTVSVTQSTKHQTEGNGRKTTKSITSDEYLIRAADAEWEQRRSREEKLVADIIDRVRRECEAQGAGGATRRGYTRRTTVMNT